MHTIVVYFANHCLASQLINDSEYDWFIYSFERRISKLFTNILLLILGSFLASFSTTLIYILSLSLLRRYTSGYHSNSYSGCLFLSTLMLLSTLKLLIPLFSIQRCSLFLFFSSIIIILLSPYNHKNVHLTHDELSINRKKSLVSLCILILLVFIFLFFKLPLQAYAAVSGIFFTAVLLLLAILQERIMIK